MAGKIKQLDTVFKVYQRQSPEELAKNYNNWACTYDQDMTKESFNGPKLVVEVAKKYLIDLPRNCRILDIGAGTGKVGSMLKAFGYDNIDAHNGSEEMLEYARKGNVYKNFYVERFEGDIPSKLIPSNTFDLVLGSGIFSPRAMDSRHLQTLCGFAKKGGKIMFIINEEWIYPSTEYNWWTMGGAQLEKKMKEMEDQQKWKLLERVVKENYIHGSKGIVFAFEKF